MAFRNWNDLAKNELVLPIGGHEYTIPPLGYLDQLKIKESQDKIRAMRVAWEAANAAGKNPPPLDFSDVIIPDEQFLKMLLGGALEQMRGNNAPAAAIVHAASVAHVAALDGRAAAEAMWEAFDPEALAAQMAAQQRTTASSSKGSTRSRSTASANRTRSRASTTGTNSRRATPGKAAAKKAAASRGTTSSPKST
jgi:hypothetical protein